MTCQKDIRHTKTCHRRFQEWVRCGTFEKVLRALVQGMSKERGKLDLTECLPSMWQPLSLQKGGRGGGKTKRGKGTKLMAMADGAGLPIAISIGSASPHEVKLVETTLKARFTKVRPKQTDRRSSV